MLTMCRVFAILVPILSSLTLWRRFFYVFCFIALFCNSANALIREVPGQKEQIQLSFAPLVKAAQPAVVNVYAARKVTHYSPFEDDPFFQYFFSQTPLNRRAQPQSALGSGVIVDKTGIIVTNYHVIRGADEIRVALADGREFHSKVLLKDERTDIALLKINNKGIDLPILPLADSDSVEVGDLVLALGNPFGVGQTVTSGIVSAQARTHVGISDLDFFIQTDAAINPGNSGGALINMRGQLIGINTAIYSRSGGSVGIGFAIPANLVRAVINSVKQGHKAFEPPYLGASFQAVTPSIAASLGWAQAAGALVLDVVKDSPAAKAGLMVGDILLKIDNRRIDNLESLSYRFLTAEIGKSLAITYWRKGQQLETHLTLTSLPKNRKEHSRVISGDNPFSGARVSENHNDASFYRGSPSGRGVFITEVADNSIAASFFQKGDRLLAVNGVKISKLADLDKILRARAPKYWQINYMRDGVVIRQLIH